MDTQRRVVTAFGQSSGALSPLTAELVAMETTVLTGPPVCGCAPIARHSSIFGKANAMMIV